MLRLNLPVVADVPEYESHFHDSVWRQAAAAICARHHLPYASLRRSPQGENIVFFIDHRFMLKIFAPFRDSYWREKAALEFANGKLGIDTPEMVHTGDLEGWSYLVMTQLAGLPAREVWSALNAHERIALVSRLGAARAGRPVPPLIAHAPVCVHDNVAEVYVAVREQIMNPRLPFYQHMFIAAGFPEAKNGVWSDGMIDATVLWGNEARVTERLHELLAWGATEILVTPVPAGANRSASLDRTLHLLGQAARAISRG